jgi:hypothetical protein
MTFGVTSPTLCVVAGQGGRQGPDTAPNPLSSFRRSVYSQNGEDGVIAEINRRLGVTGGWFCEFGAWDGRYLSNTYRLLRQGWSGVMIEGDPDRFKRLSRLAERHPSLHPLCRYVAGTGPDRLDAVLAETPIPSEFGVLSIDIDGSDYQVWEGLHDYRPAVVVIEITSAVLPGVRRIHGQDGAKGSSFTSMLELGEVKGYELVCHIGNMIFVRSDLTNPLSLDLSEPDRMFHRGYLNSSRITRLRRKAHNVSPDPPKDIWRSSLGH